MPCSLVQLCNQTGIGFLFYNSLPYLSERTGMKSILQPAAEQELRRRIQALTTATPRRWGTLSVEEMLWHLRSQLELALGMRLLHTQVRSVLRLPPLRWLALYVIPWPKGSATAPEMNARKRNAEVQELAIEQGLLLQRLSDVLQAQQLGPHPLFGALSRNDWGRLIWKHIDHHMRQFGV